MCDLNEFHLEGKVTKIVQTPCEEVVVYNIRLAVRDNERYIGGRENERFGQDGFFNITAFGTDEGDPWAELAQNDFCAIDGVIQQRGSEAGYGWRDFIIDGTLKGKKVRGKRHEATRVDGSEPVYVGTSVRLVDGVCNDLVDRSEEDPEMLPVEWYKTKDGAPHEPDESRMPPRWREEDGLSERDDA